MIFQMQITSDNPDRYLPPSWNFPCDSDDPADIWAAAMVIAQREKVNVVRIVDNLGREIWE